MTDTNEKKSISINPVEDGVVNRIAAGTVQTGDLHCAGGLWVDGKIVGNLVVDGILVLNVTGEICGNVHVRGPRALLAGSILEAASGASSEVVVNGVAELGATLRAKANITAEALDWYHGAMVDGTIQTGDRQMAAAA